jgi:hypothetical protein
MIEELRNKLLDRQHDRYNPETGEVEKLSAFSDEELQELLNSNGGNLRLAAAAGLNVLIEDDHKLEVWSRAAAGIDYQKLRRDLRDVARRYREEAVHDAFRDDDEMYKKKEATHSLEPNHRKIQLTA